MHTLQREIEGNTQHSKQLLDEINNAKSALKQADGAKEAAIRTYALEVDEYSLLRWVFTRIDRDDEEKTRLGGKKLVTTYGDFGRIIYKISSFVYL